MNTMLPRLPLPAGVVRMNQSRLLVGSSGCFSAILASGDTMIRSDVIQMENMTALDVQAIPTAPVRDLNEVLDQIVLDATANAAEYLKVTKVPYGGE